MHSKSGFVVLELGLSLCTPNGAARFPHHLHVVASRLAPGGQIERHIKVAFCKLQRGTRWTALRAAKDCPPGKIYGHRSQLCRSK